MECIENERKYTKKYNSWWTWFLLVDIVLVSVTALFPHIPQKANLIGYGTVRSFLHELSLQMEMNIAVWWASMCLFITALLCYELSKEQENDTQLAWGLLAVCFLGFSVDEIGSLHERIFQDWATVLATLFAGLLVLSFAFWRLLRDEKSRPSAALLLVGLGLMVSVVPQEYIEHHVDWPSSLVGVRAGVEEGSEIFGTLLCLIAVVRQRRELPWPNVISRAIPNPYRMRGVGFVIKITFIAHIIFAIITLKYIDIAFYGGDPAIFFPSAIYLLLSAACFWRAYAEPTLRSGWSVQALLSIVASIATIYLLSPETMSFVVILGELTMLGKIASLWVLYLSIAGGLLLVRNHWSMRRKGITCTIIAGLLMLTYLLNQQLANYITAGVVGVLMSTIIIEKPPEESLESYTQE